MIRDLIRRIRLKGFVGPYYGGLLGKARFVAESLVSRNELILVATPRSFEEARPPRETGVTLHPILRFDELKPYEKEFETAYYAGYVASWKAPFTWGEEAVVGTVNGHLACYNWMQRGTPEGYPTYYGRMFEDEARVLRAGVLPQFRGRGLNAAMKHALLTHFFSHGVRRVYAEAYAHNIPSIRSLLRAGFRPMGVITILEAPPLRNFVRWQPPTAMTATLERLGLPSS